MDNFLTLKFLTSFHLGDHLKQVPSALLVSLERSSCILHSTRNHNGPCAAMNIHKPTIFCLPHDDSSGCCQRDLKYHFCSILEKNTHIRKHRSGAQVILSSVCTSELSSKRFCPVAMAQKSIIMTEMRGLNFLRILKQVKLKSKWSLWYGFTDCHTSSYIKRSGLIP